MSNINVNTLTPLTGTTGTISVSGSLHVSGNLSANGTLTLGNENTDNIALNAEFTSSLVPDLNNVFTLGTAVKQWKDLHVDGVGNIDTLGAAADATTNAYITTATIATLKSSGSGGNVTVSASLIPFTDNSTDLGSSTKMWKDLYVDGKAYIHEISGSTNGGERGSLTASVHIVPGTSNLYDLGNEATKFRNLYLHGTASFGELSVSTGSISLFNTHLKPTLDKTYDLGTSALQWRVGHITTASVAHLQSKAGGVILSSGSLNPQTTAVWDLGTMSNAWRNLHAHGLAHIHTASIGVVSSSLLPNANNSYDLGSSTQKWKNLHVGTQTNTISASIAYLTGSVDGANSGYLTIGSPTVPGINNKYDLGSSTAQWKDIYIDGKAYIDEITGSDQNGSRVMSSSVDIIPSITNIYDLGSSSQRWKNIWAAGYISASGEILGLSGSFGNVAGTLTTAAQPNITSVGQLTSLNSTGNSTLGNAATDTHFFTGNITASGNISASGTITANAFVGPITGTVTGTSTGLTGTPSILVANITSSGNISASGTVTANSLVGTNLPTSLGSATSKEFYTLSGSQIFSSSAFPGGSQPQVFLSGATSASLFVFLKP